MEMLQNSKHFIFEADDVRASHRAHVITSKIKRIFVLQKQLTTNGIKSQHHRKARAYKTIVSDQPILTPSNLLWRNTSQMRLEMRNYGETAQQNEQPNSVDQSALSVSNTGRRPASFIKRPASFIKHEGRLN